MWHKNEIDKDTDTWNRYQMDSAIQGVRAHPFFVVLLFEMLSANTF
jgi:hypothetical protein